jgi:hypothetical protein
MFVWQEHRINCNDIGGCAFAGTRDWRQWLEDRKFCQPQLANRGRGRRGSLVSNYLRSLTRQWNRFCRNHRTGRQQNYADTK